MTLDRITSNVKVKVLRFENDKRIITRINNVGIKVGDTITVANIAPFGTPVEIKTGNIRLAIARSEATKITVEYV